jgi:hypothetical protein
LRTVLAAAALASIHRSFARWGVEAVGIVVVAQLESSWRSARCSRRVVVAT